MYMELHEIADVIAGYTFRGAIKPDNKGSIAVFQAKDLVQGQPFQDTSSLTLISQDIPGYAGHLKKNDVLLIARGMKSGAFRSTLFLADEHNVVASSSVHIVRITAPNILPEYVSHYLNTADGQLALAGIVSGSYIGALPRKELEKIKIPIPTLRKQEALINLYRNIREQQKILDRKKEIKENIISATFRNLTTKK